MIRAKGASRIIITSDIVMVGGLPPADYDGDEVGLAAGEVVRLEANGKCHMPIRGCLAGSGSTMLQCMKHLESLDILSEVRLLNSLLIAYPVFKLPSLYLILPSML